MNLLYIALALLLILVLAIPALVLLLQVRRFASPNRGEHVVEVWLEWPLCRGSTLYRQRFRSRWLAYASMRIHAMMLDMELPTHWRSTDWHGKPCLERYDYGIHYGMRKPTSSERELGVHTLWSPVLPGHQGHAGEHREAHPLWADNASSAEELGYKL